jgi:hypothetical protein
MQYKKFGNGSRLALFGFVFFCLCLSGLSLSAQSSGGSQKPVSEAWQLPEWLKPPMHQQPPSDPSKPLLTSMADSLESWGTWSIQDETYHQTVINTVKAILISSDEREKAHQKVLDAKDAEIAAYRIENELLKSQIRSRIEVGLLSGGGGLLGGFALGLWAGASINK